MLFIATVITFPLWFVPALVWTGLNDARRIRRGCGQPCPACGSPVDRMAFRRALEEHRMHQAAQPWDRKHRMIWRLAARCSRCHASLGWSEGFRALIVIDHPIPEHSMISSDLSRHGRPAHVVRRWRWLRRLALALGGGAAVVLLMALLAEWRIGAEGARCFAVAAVPPTRTALVLGTGPRLADGTPNAFFATRIRAAVDLYRAGTVDRILVSGDNHRAGYDEPTEMRAALLARGVPDAAIRRDFAGFRTLDSVVRAKAVFGCDRVVIVSQRWHNERALYLAWAAGLDAVAADAAEPAVWVPGLWWRERLARMRCLLDVHLLGTEPRFPGPPEPW
jgi:SanA protein